MMAIAPGQTFSSPEPKTHWWAYSIGMPRLSIVRCRQSAFSNTYISSAIPYNKWTFRFATVHNLMNHKFWVKASRVNFHEKGNSLRFCIDFRKFNSRTNTDAYSLPLIEETIDSLSGSKYFSKLDLRSGFWQVGIKEADKHKTAFSAVPLGFFECNHMTFGLINALATFQNLMEHCMGELHLKECLIYLDGHYHLQQGIRRIHETPWKCIQTAWQARITGQSFFHVWVLFKNTVQYLGHIGSDEGVQTDPDKIAILKLDEYRRAISSALMVPISQSAHRLSGHQFDFTEKSQYFFGTHIRIPNS